MENCDKGGRSWGAKGLKAVDLRQIRDGMRIHVPDYNPRISNSITLRLMYAAVFSSGIRKLHVLLCMFAEQRKTRKERTKGVLEEITNVGSLNCSAIRQKLSASILKNAYA